MTEYVRHLIKIDAVRSWSVIVGAGIAGELTRHFDVSGYSSIVLVTDTAVGKLYGERIIRALEIGGRPLLVLTLPPGERTKSLRTAQRCYQYLMENKIDRRALLCALGGGVIGDLGGYIAASYLRGIDYLQMPTTLLAQVDSSIGGKVGVNFGGKKNLVGAFYQPQAIICDMAFLQSLGRRQLCSGLAEVLKYGLAMDAGLYSTLEARGRDDFSEVEMADIVLRCCRLKAGVVEVDETERSGQRAILNFGHTVGHALEAVTGLRRMSHGAAVAVGMVAAARISARVGLLKADVIPGIERLLHGFGLPTSCHGVNPDDLLAAIRYDKKTVDGETGWVLLEGIGRGVVGQAVPAGVVREVLEEVCR